jgi:(1->4)-alpha-D-glucan 1-alpha-D-glucosylmutase
MLAGLRRTGGAGLQPKIREISENPTDGMVKLFVTSRALCFRKAHADLMTEGSYLPLRAAGRRQNHVVAFARSLNRRAVIAASGRFFMSLGPPGRVPVGEEAWGDAVLMLRRDLARTAYRDIFSQATVEVGTRNGQPVLPLAQIFAHLPVALLEPVE